MVTFSNALRAVAVSSCLLGTTAVLQAGIIDDGASDANHTSLANQSQYDAVGVIHRDGGELDSSGTLISSEWVLTAAHTIVSGGGPNATFTVNGETRNIVEAIRNPGYTDSLPDGHDIALLRLDSPITSVAPAQIYTGLSADLVGESLTYVGYGKTGTGSTGDTGAAGTKRAGHNIAEQLGYILNPGVDQVEYSDQLIFADMDAFTGPWENPLGSTLPVGLEYLIALGDSGGGLFVEDNGQHYLAGVHSLLFNLDPFGTLGYGDIMASTTVESFLTWINQTIYTGDLNGDGFVGVDDLNIVLTHWNQNVTPGDLSMGDITGEGFVGVDDLNTILVNWNIGTPPSLSQALAAVPEPGTIGLLVGLSGVMLYRRRVC